MRISRGRVLVRLIPVSNEIGGLVSPEAKNQWGILEQKAAPSHHQFDWWQMLKWYLSGIHPLRAKIGTKVLLSGTRGIQILENDTTYVLLYQDDIALWE